MTETLASMGSSMEAAARKLKDPVSADQATIAQLVKAARARGDDLTGPNGLLKQHTATVLETALDGEMDEHLGYEKHDVAGRGTGNSQNGTRTMTMLTDNAGPVQVTVPRDRNGTFEPVIVAKHQRRLGDVDTIALSVFAKGLTTGEIPAHFEEIYGASISKDRVSKITDEVVGEMNEWCSRPLLPVCAAVSIDAIHVKVRDGSPESGRRPQSPTGRSMQRSVSIWKAIGPCWRSGPPPTSGASPRSTE